MKHLRLILFIIFVLSLGNAFGQSHIYERYAPRADLDVAYLENLPLDSTTSVNATIIIAKDSATWESLKEELNIPNPVYPPNTRCYGSSKRDKYDPKNHCDDNHDCCMMIVNYYRRSVTLFYYDTHAQYELIIDFSMKKHLHEVTSKNSM